MLEQVYHWFSGYVEFRVEGDGARLLTIAAKRGLSMWGFRREEGKAVARIKPRTYKKLRQVARRCQATTKITCKRGLPFQCRRAWQRKGMLLGVVGAAALYWFLSGFIWGVSVSGAETIPPRLILQAAKDCGVFSGARKDSPKFKGAEVSLLNRMPELSWVAVNTNGCYAEVVVKEGTPKPKQENLDEYSNIVAAREGQVVKLEAQEGRPEVVLGQTVTKGQLLIAGLYQEIPDPYGPQPDRLVQRAGPARGSVTAETYREFTVQASAVKTVQVETGRSERTWLEIFGLKLPLGVWSRPAGEARSYRKRSQVKLLGVELPLAVERETVVLLGEERRGLSEEQQKTAALLKLREAQKAALPPGSSVREEKLEFSFTEGMCILSAKCRCWEEIGEVRKISVE